jgi:predicted amidohydrolase
VLVGFLQFAPQLRSESENLRFIVSRLGSLRRAIVVLPELFLGSYRTPLPQDDLERRLAPLVELSRRRSLSIVGSLPVRADDRVFNRAVAIDGGRLRAVYDKVRVFEDEALTFTRGGCADNVVELQGVRCSVQVCMDVADPLPVNRAAHAGAQVLLGPSTVSVDFIRTIHRARSLENQIVSVFCNRHGCEPLDGTAYLGRSAIFLPDGSEEGAGGGEDRLTTIRLERSDLRAMSEQRRRLIPGA